MKRTLLLAMLVTGCGSFNTTYITETTPYRPEVPTPKKETSAPDIPSAVPVVQPVSNGRTYMPKRLVCGKYVAPTLPELPAIPIEQLKRIDPADHKAIDRVLTQHINDVRKIVLDYRKAESEAKARHWASCHLTHVEQ